MVKNLPASGGDLRDTGLLPGWGRSPGGGHGNPLQYSFLENLHGQRNLGDYSPWGLEESDTAEVTEHTHAYMFRMGNVSKSEDSGKGCFPNM